MISKTIGLKGVHNIFRHTQIIYCFWNLLSHHLQLCARLSSVLSEADGADGAGGAGGAGADGLEGVATW